MWINKRHIRFSTRIPFSDLKLSCDSVRFINFLKFLFNENDNNIFEIILPVKGEKKIKVLYLFVKWKMKMTLLINQNTLNIDTADNGTLKNIDIILL